MLTGNEKAWMAVVVGTVVQAVDVVIAFLPQTPDLATARLVLLIIAGVVGTIGQGLGVYSITNTPQPAQTPLPGPVGPVPATVPVAATTAPAQTVAAPVVDGIAHFVD